MSKCSFGQETMSFLSHIISGDGVQSDPQKISAIVDWPIPKTIKQLREFLGLTGYYRIFVKHYAQLASAVTDLLRKDAFIWTEKATESFNKECHDNNSSPLLP